MNRRATFAAVKAGDHSAMSAVMEAADDEANVAPTNYILASASIRSPQALRSALNLRQVATSSMLVSKHMRVSKSTASSSRPLSETPRCCPRTWPRSWRRSCLTSCPGSRYRRRPRRRPRIPRALRGVANFIHDRRRHDVSGRG